MLDLNVFAATGAALIALGMSAAALRLAYEDLLSTPAATEIVRVLSAIVALSALLLALVYAAGSGGWPPLVTALLLAVVVPARRPWRSGWRDVRGVILDLLSVGCALRVLGALSAISTPSAAQLAAATCWLGCAVLCARLAD